MDEGKNNSTPLWHQLPLDAVLRELGTSPEGLTVVQVQQRLLSNGPNLLHENKGISALAIFLSQFKSLIIWILLVAAIISGVVGEILDMFAIVAIVILNAVLGFYQEYKAEQSIAALKKMTAPQAKVRRNNQVSIIPAAEVVPGDILELEAGDLVVADARLIRAANMQCIEAALTGESEAVNKQADDMLPLATPLGSRDNMVFVGTSVANGVATAVVVATAMKTELGQIAHLIQEAGSESGTPLQKKLDAFGRVLVWIALSVVFFLFVLGMWRGDAPMELLMTAVSLAVAAVPEGLPAVVSVALALGVMRMTRRGALVRKLHAVETLGSTTVICTDKTGTLTVGEMTVRALFVADQYYDILGEGYEPKGDILLRNNKIDISQDPSLNLLTSILMGCNNAHLQQHDNDWKVIGDPTEGAMLVAAIKAGGNVTIFEQQFPKCRELPFDSNRKRSSIIRRMPDSQLRVMVNGAPDMLLQQCTQIHTGNGVRLLTDEDRQNIIAQNQLMAQRALRVLGSAYRDIGKAIDGEVSADNIEQELVFVGLTGMYDPPRAEVKVAVSKCHTAGIRVVMITGDHPHTAMAIANKLGITAAEDQVMTGPELDQLNDEELQQRVGKVAVYARVTAAHKLRIVRAWKSNKAIVAMTGDGVNDAPAIEGADIGIAMGRSGTEVTKQSSDIVITDDNFATIVAAIEEGRGIYVNIRKTLQYLLAGNLAEILFMAFCIVLALPIPLLPIHLLWINLVTDGLPALCLATDPVDPDVMQRPPRQPDEKITNASFLGMMFLTGILTAGVAFVVYWHSLQTESMEMARTEAFAVLVFAELLRSFGARSETRPVWKISLRTNMMLVAVVTISFGLQVWSHHQTMLGQFLKTSALPLDDCLMLLLVGAIPLLVLEVFKVAKNHVWWSR